MRVETEFKKKKLGGGGGGGGGERVDEWKVGAARGGRLVCVRLV